MFPANIVPGQGFIFFDIYETGATVTDSGRAVQGAYKNAGKPFMGMLVNASQKEIDQWKQNGHPISHKIIEYSALNVAKATDCLHLKEEGRTFYVQGTKNPINMGITTIYYVEERLDIKLVQEG